MSESQSYKNSESSEINGKSICLVGNVNVGKSTLFNALAENRQHEKTCPGTVVVYNTARIKGGDDTLMDLPGINSLLVSNEDEKEARNLIIKGEVGTIIHVLDAHNMIRSISLALQMAEFGIPTVFALNKDDMAQVRGIRVDIEKLAVLFGVKVTRTVAREKLGIANLRDSLVYCAVPKKLLKFPDDTEQALREITALLEGKVYSARGIAMLLLADDASIKQLIESDVDPTTLFECGQIVQELQEQRRKPISLTLSEHFMYQATRLSRDFQQKKPDQKTQFLTELGRSSTRLSLGIPQALLMMVFMYLLVGKLGAEYLVGLLEGKLFGEFIIPQVTNLLAPLNTPWITDLFCGDFGLVSMGLGLAFGVLLPVLLTFYIFYGILEDSGYLPRLSVLLDNLLRKMGMNGKGVMPLIMGFSCITMAIMTARMLDTKKEKFIVTLLLTLGIPCAPLLSVMFVIFAKLHWSAMLVVFGVLIVKIIIVGIIANKLVPGQRGAFIIEIPPLRIPDFHPVFKRAVLRLTAFLKEAVPVFLFASVILFVFDKMGGLDAMRAFFSPTAKWLLGLPEHSVEVLVMTLVRREAGAALLDQFFNKGLFNGVQAVVILIVMTSLLPCVNAVIVLFKERGWKQASVIVGVVMPAAILVGTIVNYVCVFTGVTFLP